MRRLVFPFLPALLLALVPLAPQAAAAPIHLKNYRALVRIKSPRFSPDGQQIAFLAVRSDFVHDRYDATLRVMNTAGGNSRVLVHAMLDVHMPRWSPDGHTIAFIASVGNEKPQIYAVPAAGGAPQKLSDAPNGVQQFAWSPDGSTVAYVTPEDSPLSARDRNTHHDLFTIHHDDYLINQPPVPSHIWLLSLKSRKARRLTHGSTSVLETAPPFGGGISAPTWSADGRWIVYTQQANANDLDAARAGGLAAPLLDRLKLTPQIIDTVAEGCEQIASMPDPVGEISGVKRRPSGISVGQMRVPLGVFGAVYLVEYGKTNWLARLIRFFADVMTGVPSIFVGLFVYTALVISFGFSAIMGAASLAIIMMPIVLRSTEEMLKLVPTELKDASYGLGAAKWQTVTKVILPSAAPGITTGVMLAVARAAGETAPLLLTALGSIQLTAKFWSGPMQALPLAIFDGARNPFAAGQARAWAGALELILIILVLTVVARVISSRSRISR